MQKGKDRPIPSGSRNRGGDSFNQVFRTSNDASCSRSTWSTLQVLLRTAQDRSAFSRWDSNRAVGSAGLRPKSAT